ncbi:MAG: sulfatase-like hydrolase/transferase, partial [Planctomycetota bacterium]
MQRRIVRTAVIALACVAAVMASAVVFRHLKPDRVTARSLEGFNLIIINIDSLRRDHLSCYGYERDTSPFIDSLAESGIVFEQAMSNSSFTCESVAALMSGLLPSNSGSFGFRARLSARTKNLGTLFKEAGYRTGFFSNSMMLRDQSFAEGFDESETVSREWDKSRGGPELSSMALDFLRRHSGQKFMLYLHYLDPHGPYQPPDDLYSRFAEKRF